MMYMETAKEQSKPTKPAWMGEGTTGSVDHSACIHHK